jgi:methylthioribose-1-phosphate isomerase
MKKSGGASTISPTPSGLHRADLENFAMGHFARMFFIGIISTAASCSQLAQKDEDRKEMGRQLADAYYSCVRTSFASQRPTMVDRNMAIDQAFTVCKTEEGKLQTFENALSETQNGNNSAILAHRNKLGEELSR